MKKSKFSESQIVAILREGEAGVAVEQILRKHGILLLQRSRRFCATRARISRISPT